MKFQLLATIHARELGASIPVSSQIDTALALW